MSNKIRFQKTIGVDFDGTITSRDTVSANEIPIPRKNAVNIINKWVDEGYIVIINTLRGVEPWESACRAYLDKLGIKYSYFNENAVERIEVFGDVRKIAADIYIDDRNLYGIPEDFYDIDRIVKSEIGYPYKEVDGKLVESRENDKLTASDIGLIKRNRTGFAGRFSEEFLSNVKTDNLYNYVFNSMMAGHVTEYQIIENLLKEVVKQTSISNQVLIASHIQNDIKIIN